VEWIRSFGKEDRRLLGLDLLRVQENWPIGMPVCRPLGRGLWEVRSSLSGSKIARMMFCIRGGEIFVLNGFVKKSQKTPAREIEIALRRMKEVMA
jgi:phage-related protein